MYSVNGVKSFIGNEGYGFNANLLRDGKKVAFLIDDANGGEINVQWLDWKAPKVEVKGINYTGKEYTHSGTPEQAKLAKFLMNLPKTKNPYDGKMEHVSRDVYLCELVDKFESEKQFKRWCKTKVCFRVKGDKEGSWRTLKAKFHPLIAEKIREKFGDQLEEILNERFV